LNNTTCSTICASQQTHRPLSENLAAGKGRLAANMTITSPVSDVQRRWVGMQTGARLRKREPARWRANTRQRPRWSERGRWITLGGNRSLLLVGLIVLIVAAAGIIFYQMRGAGSSADASRMDAGKVRSQGPPGTFTPAPR